MPSGLMGMRAGGEVAVSCWDSGRVLGEMMRGTEEGGGDMLLR